MANNKLKLFNNNTNGEFKNKNNHIKEHETIYSLALTMNVRIFWLILIIALSTATSVIAAGQEPQVPSTSIVYYNFSSNSTVFVLDKSPQQFNGTPSGIIWNNTGGFLGYGGVNFNGQNSSITINGSSQATSIYANSNITTISGWVYINPDEKGTGSSGTQYIASKGLTGNFEWQLAKSNGTAGYQLLFQIFSSDGSASANLNILTTYANNTWYYVAIVSNGTNIISYLNGKQVATITQNKFNLTGTTNTILGSRGGTGFFNGSISDFIIENRTVQPSEIWQRYQNYLVCIVPTINSVLVYNTTICTNTYYMNASNLNSILSIGSNDAVIDCQGSTFVGNQTAMSSAWRSRGISTQTFPANNTLVKNCGFDGYYTALLFRNSLNNNATNITTNNTYITFNYDNVVGGYISNSSSQMGELYDSSSSSSYITMNNLSSVSSISHPYGVTSTIVLYNSNNITIINSRFNNQNISINFQGVSNNNSYIANNNFTIALGNEFIRYITSNPSYNTTVYRNYFNDMDAAIKLWNITNGLFLENNFYNTTRNADFYDSAFQVEYTSTNISIIRNNFTNFGSTGVLLRQTYGFNITGNLFNNDNSALLAYNYDCISPNICNSEPITAVFIEQIFKGFIPIGTKVYYNLSQATLQNSSNGSITNNTFYNISVLLRLQGGSNITNDLNSSVSWYKKFYQPYFLDSDEMWIDQNFNSPFRISNNAISYNLFQGIYTNYSYNYSINKNYTYLQSITPFNRSVNMYNLTDALIYLSNGSVGCSNIPSCDNDINITLGSLQYVYSLEIYSINQSVVRLFDPVSVISTTASNRLLASSLVDNITNVTVSVFVGASNVLSPSMTTIYGKTNITSYSIANGLFTFNTTITPGSNLVVLDASTLPQTPAQVRTGACASSAASFASLAPWMIVFVTVLCAIFVVMAVKGVFNFQLMIVGVISILLLSFLMMFGIIIFTSVASICT